MDVSVLSSLSFVRSEDRQTETSTDVAKTQIQVHPDTKTYYSSIEEAVQANDLPKPLSLLDKAKAREIEGAQKVFWKAVNARNKGNGRTKWGEDLHPFFIQNSFYVGCKVQFNHRLVLQPFKLRRQRQ